MVVYLGIEIYLFERMRVSLLERDPVRGFGYLNPPLEQTGFIHTWIVVPKRLIFFGVLPALVPPTVTPDYSLDIDIIRRRILKYWEA